MFVEDPGLEPSFVCVQRDVGRFRVVSSRVVNVLLLEDDEIDAKLIAMQIASFKDLDVRIVHASSVSEAREALGQEKFDVAIIDYWLGCESSLRFLAELDVWVRGLPAIVLTGLCTSDIRDLCMHAGAVGFLDKAPLTAEAFEAAVVAALDRRTSTC